MRRFTVGSLTCQVDADASAVARAAAKNTAEVLRAAVAARGHARVILATGNSQTDFVEALAGERIPWGEVTAFHMDEYLGVGDEHPASFRRWIRERIADRFHPFAVHYIDGLAADPEAEASRYEALLREAPIDLTCMGIGENGHLAFNEPGAARFDDPRWAAVISLTPESIDQQVGEGHFSSTVDVPRHAISLTIPALLSAAQVQVVAPDARKATAVARALAGPVEELCPASILTTTSHAKLFLDEASAGQLP